MDAVSDQCSLADIELVYALCRFSYQMKAFCCVELPVLTKQLVSDFQKEVTASIPVADGLNSSRNAHVFTLNGVHQIRMEEGPQTFIKGVPTASITKMQKLSVEHWRVSLLRVLKKIHECIRQNMATIIDEIFTSSQQLPIRLKIHEITTSYLDWLCQNHEQEALERCRVEHSIPFTMDTKRFNQLASQQLREATQGSPDTAYRPEQEMIAAVRAYYIIAGTRFVDGIYQNAIQHLFTPLQDDFCSAIQKKLYASENASIISGSSGFHGPRCSTSC